MKKGGNNGKRKFILYGDNILFHADHTLSLPLDYLSQFILTWRRNTMNMKVFDLNQGMAIIK